MNTSYHIAIDMGAGSIRVLVGKLGDDKISYEEIFRFKNEISSVDGSDKWDIENIYNNIIQGINLALEKHPGIESVGIDSWGVDYVLLDENGELVEIPYSYRDKRTEGMPEKWQTLMGEKETFQRTGVNFYIFNTLFQLLAAKETSAIKKADKLLFIPNYIYYRLTGKMFNEVTIASTSQMLKVDKNEFDEEILKKPGLKPEMFEPVVEAGKFKEPINEPLLKPNKIKAVSVCSHDTASAIAGVPVDSGDFLFIATGTWCILGTEAETPLLSEPARALGFTNERGCGNTYRTLKNIVGLWLVQGIQKALPGNPSFAELEEMANNAGDVDVLVNPEDELFYNPVNMLEAFDLFFEKTGQKKPGNPGQYVACAYKSLSVAFAYYLQKLSRLTKKEYEKVHVFGGGSRSEMLCRFISDFTGMEVISGPVEAATYGNIITQAIALGKVKNLEEGRRIIKNSVSPKRYTPSLKQEEKEEIFKRYLSLKTY